MIKCVVGGARSNVQFTLPADSGFNFQNGGMFNAGLEKLLDTTANKRIAGEFFYEARFKGLGDAHIYRQKYITFCKFKYWRSSGFLF